MKKYEYKVSAMFADGDSAARALESVNSVFPKGVKTFVVSPDDKHVDRKLEPETGAVKRELVSFIFRGIVIGAVVGVLVAIVLSLVGASFFTASPAQSLVWSVFYSATIGGVLGALYGLRMGDGQHSAEIKDELADDNYVVMVHVRDSELATRVEDLLNRDAISTSTN